MDRASWRFGDHIASASARTSGAWPFGVCALYARKTSYDVRLLTTRAPPLNAVTRARASLPRVRPRRDIRAGTPPRARSRPPSRSTKALCLPGSRPSRTNVGSRPARSSLRRRTRSRSCSCCESDAGISTSGRPSMTVHPDAPSLARPVSVTTLARRAVRNVRDLEIVGIHQASVVAFLESETARGGIESKSRRRGNTRTWRA